MDPAITGWATMIGQFGLPTLLVCVFVYASVKREGRMADAIEDLQKDQKDMRGTVIKENQEIIRENTKVIAGMKEHQEHSTAVVERLERKLSGTWDGVNERRKPHGQ